VAVFKCPPVLAGGHYRILQLLILVLVSQSGSFISLAQSQVSTPVENMGASVSLSLAVVLDSALTNAPLAQSESNYRELADTHDALGNRLISGRPSWQMSYIDDSLLDDYGLREMETGVSFNLWRRGERADTALLGDKYDEQLNAWQDHLRLVVAGQVRNVLADLAEAEAMLEIARQASVDAERLVAITLSMESAGAAAQADVLQARTQLLQQQQLELQAEAELGIAERRYSILTGLSIKPADALSESIVSARVLSAAHPTLKFLQSQVDIASAGVALTRHQSNGRANMSVGVRRERGVRLQPFTDSFGVSLSLPFGSNPATAASVSVARTQQVDAEIRLLQTRRQLEGRLRELEREMTLATDSLALGQERVAIASQRYEMSLSAFEVGESDLTQVVIAQQQARQSERDLASLTLDQQRLISEYNQTIGVLP